MQIEAAFSLSEEYYKFMSDFAQTSFEDDKLLGKFYTDFTVAKRMVETIVENVKLDVFSRDIKLIDPFCGDGRLISETIIQLIQKDIIHGRKLYISLWDIDEVAVNVAKQNVKEICNTYQLSYEIDQMYEIVDEASLRYAIKDYLRFYSEERPQDRYDCKTPLEVRQEALSSDVPTEYPIPENKRISKYKEKWCA